MPISTILNITGESSWQPPEAWKLKPSEVWVRNKDERDNVYYYNMQTGRRKGLPIYQSQRPIYSPF